MGVSRDLDLADGGAVQFMNPSREFLRRAADVQIPGKGTCAVRNKPFSFTYGPGSVSVETGGADVILGRLVVQVNRAVGVRAAVSPGNAGRDPGGGARCHGRGPGRRGEPGHGGGRRTGEHGGHPERSPHRIRPQLWPVPRPGRPARDQCAPVTWNKGCGDPEWTLKEP